MTRRVAALVAFALGVAACAGTIDQRTTQGPTAEQFWLLRMAQINGRQPNFEERRHWQDHLDEEIARYLRAHPEAANSLDVSTFRFYRQTTVGMTKDQVRILLGPPLSMTAEPVAMEKLARQHWPAIKPHATEAWVYPLGWSFYFAADRVVDITQYLPR